MIATAALRLAGDAAVLVARPHGVAHVYVGRLTPSGRRTPRHGGRAVCNTRTGVLWVVERSWGPLDPGARRLCRRCVAVLDPGKAGAATPTTRGDWVHRFDGLTAFDLALAAFMAETLAEVERTEYLAMLLVGWPAMKTDPVVSPAGKVSRPLLGHLTRARNRVGGTHEQLVVTAARADALTAAAGEQRARDRRALHTEREARIERLGYVAATA